MNPKFAMIAILVLLAAVVVLALIPPQLGNAIVSLASPVKAGADDGKPSQVESPFSGVVLYQCAKQPVHETKISELQSIFRYDNNVTVPAGCPKNVLLAKDYHSTENALPDGSIVIGIWPGAK